MREKQLSPVGAVWLIYAHRQPIAYLPAGGSFFPDAMTQKEYNGWFNYETWLVNLWMTSEEGSCRFNERRAQDTYNAAEADKTFTKVERATLDLSDALKEEYENAEYDLLEQAKATVSIWADLLGAALSEVNWHEIGEHLIGNVAKKDLPEAK